MDDIIDKFNSYTHKPVKFMTVQNDLKDDIKNLVKSLYDYTKTQEKNEEKFKSAALPELIVKDFDEEQIWQEIELQNSHCWDHLVKNVAECVAKENGLNFPVTTTNPEKSKKSKKKTISQNKCQPDEILPTEEKQVQFKNQNILTAKKKSKPSIVDDKFFRSQEMEEFLLQEEKKEGKKVANDSDDESIDYFEDVDDESGDENGDMMYSDFFDSQEKADDQNDDDMDTDEEISNAQDDVSGDEFDFNHEEPDTVQNTGKKTDKKVTFALESENEDSSEDSEDNNEVELNKQSTKNEKKSDFELRQQRLQEHISKLEEKTLSEAPWQLKGEVDASKRPQNSLLQEVVDFDLTTRPAPIITEQTTVTLEGLIRQRIKDKAWDDIERKEKPVDDQLNFRKKEVLDQSKSKQSLAEVYEAEYLKQKQALTGEIEDEKEPETHTQIREAMSKLFSKLDALCHYHYTPKAPKAEVKIVSNTPAISMEEVAPVATSDAALLAPEEVKKKQRGDLISKEERTQMDKNRERRKKKKLQRQKGKVMKVTDHRNTKKGVEASDKSLKTSKAFFQQLNETATSLIKNKKNKSKG